MNVGKTNPMKVSGKGSSSLRIPQMPLEWLDRGTWRLPSGKALAEFALQAGFLAPLLLQSDPAGWKGKPSPAAGAPVPAKSVTAKEDR